MKTLSAPLIALLATRAFNWANIFNISLIDNTQLYYSGADIDILYNSNTYSAGGSIGPYFGTDTNKAKYHCKVGTEVDTLTFDVIAGTSTVSGIPFTQAIQEGIFDGAELSLHRAYWPKPNLFAAIGTGDTSLQVSDYTIFPSSGNFNILIDQEILTVTAGQGTNIWTVTRAVGSTTAAAHSAGKPIINLNPMIGGLTPTGVVDSIFVGRIAEIDACRSICTFNINSHLELLNQNMPRDIYQSGCINTLYDSSCTLNQASFAVTGTAGSGNSQSIISVSLSQSTGYFDLGKIQFTSGANNGLWRTVKAFINGSPGTLSFSFPFPNTPANGDTFTVYPGCDKMQSTCSGKFNNLVNFRGFPNIPENTTAV